MPLTEYWAPEKSSTIINTHSYVDQHVGIPLMNKNELFKTLGLELFSTNFNL